MLSIDHVVIAAQNPEQSAHAFGKTHGVTVVEGGRHDAWGTYNMLAYFKNDCYLEWLGVFDQQKAEQSTNPLIGQLVQRLKTTGDGPFQYALRTQQMSDMITHLKRSQIPLKGPFKGSRMRPDGSTLAWQMLFPNGLTTITPFLIAWNEGINRPNDSNLINDRRLQLFGNKNEDMDLFNDIYQVKVHDQEIKLDNGSIIYSQNDLSFELLE
ncbi:MAG TPA: VOC family protein [Virgibacillus sp.]|nr:VOC family protein [Virgibacillus sp.]